MRPNLRNNKAPNSGLMVCKQDDNHRTDARLERRWKRRCNAHQNFMRNFCNNNARKKIVKRKDVQKEVDRDYERFLNIWSLGNDIAHFSVDDDANADVDTLPVYGVDGDVHPQSRAEDNGDDYADPPYKLFLENLRGYENSYVLEFRMDNEISSVVYYEEDVLCDGHGLKTQPKEVTETARTLGSEEKIGSPKILNGVSAGCRAEEGDHDGDDADPHCKLFFENLREYEKSHVLEVAMDNGMSVHVFNEKGDILCDVHGLETLQKGITETARAVESEIPKVLSGSLIKRKVGRPKSKGSETARAVESEVPKVLSDGLIKRKVGRPKSKGSKIKKSLLMGKRKNLGLDMEMDDIAEPVVQRISCKTRETKNLRLEMDEIAEPTDHVAQRTRGSSTQTRKRKSLGPEINEIPKPTDHVVQRTRGNLCQTIKGKSLGLEMDEISETADHVVQRSRRNPSKRPSPEDLHPAKCNRKMKCNMVDESYEVFLNFVKLDGECMVFTPECGKQAKYEEDKKGENQERDEKGENQERDDLSDSEVIASDNDPYRDGNYTPFVTSKSFDTCIDLDDDECIATPGRSKHSWFRQKLLDALKLPFNQVEYEDLQRKINYQSQMAVHRELRGTRSAKFCFKDSLAKSYLEQFSDLEAKFNLFIGDHPRRLNLLRGFFYWLKNLAHEGAFRPWLDSSCLEIVPPM